MLRRFLLILCLSILFIRPGSAEEVSSVFEPIENQIPKTAIILVDHTNQWNQAFWIDGMGDLLMDRYSYLMSPADLEVVTTNRKLDYSKDSLAKLAEEKQVDQVVVFIIERAEQTWFPSWHIGSRTNFDNDDSLVTTIFLRGAIYQPSTGKYSAKKQWENTTDDHDMERLMVKNTTKLLDRLEKEVPPLL